MSKPLAAEDVIYRQRFLSCCGLYKVADVEWGGDWVSFKDYPHYQFGAHGKAVSGARVVFEGGGRA